MRSGGYPSSVHTLRCQRQPESRFRGRRQSSCIKPRQEWRRRALPTDYRWLPVPSSLCSQTLTHTATYLTVEMNDNTVKTNITVYQLVFFVVNQEFNYCISLKFISHYESYDKTLGIVSEISTVVECCHCQVDVLFKMKAISEEVSLYK